MESDSLCLIRPFRVSAAAKRNLKLFENEIPNDLMMNLLSRIFSAIIGSLIFMLVAVSSQATKAEATNSFEPVWEKIKSQSTTAQLYGFLYQLPKGGNLHTHFAGSVPMEYLLEIARDRSRNGGQEFYTRVKINNCGEDCTGRRLDYAGTSAPIVYFQTLGEATWKSLSSCCRDEYKPLSGLNEEERAAWLSSVKLDRPGEGRNEFFEVIWHRMGVLFSDPLINPELLVTNMKLFGEEGLRYLEFQLPPRGWRDSDGQSIPAEEVYEILKERLNQEDALATGVTVRFRNVAIRYLSNAEEQIEEAFAFVDSHRDLWVGVDMAGREDDDKGHPLRFLETFRKMRRRYGGIGLSIHGGEVDEPNSHVRDTLLLGATRIGHGLNLISDPGTLLLMRYRDYLIETCLVSNRVLEYFPNLDEHPFPEYLRMGIPVCLNTDDRGMWDSNMTDEYYSAVKHFNLRWGEIVKMGRDSLRYAFVDNAKKEELLSAYDRDIASFEEKYQKADWKKLTTEAKPKISPYAHRAFGINRKLTENSK